MLVLQHKRKDNQQAFHVTRCWSNNSTWAPQAYEGLAAISISIKISHTRQLRCLVTSTCIRELSTLWKKNMSAAVVRLGVDESTSQSGLAKSWISSTLSGSSDFSAWMNSLKFLDLHSLSLGSIESWYRHNFIHTIRSSLLIFWQIFLKLILQLSSTNFNYTGQDHY